jgi:hypothetical protein
MDDILTQRFSFATITPYRDYSRLDEKENNFNTYGDSDIDEMYNDSDIILTALKKESKDFIRLDRMDSYFKPIKGVVTTLPERRPKRIFFFDTKEEVQEKFKIKFAYTNKKTGDNFFETQKDNQIKRHFGKPFSSIEIKTVERSIRRHGDKITIKVYFGYKRRGFNCKYFKSGFTVNSLTVNTVTGNFTTAIISKNGKANSKQFRINSFEALNRIVMGTGFLKIGGYVANNSKFKSDFEEVFDNVKFTAKIQEALEFGLGHINYSANQKQFITDLIEKFFVIKKKIKVPNGDYEFLITKLYPTEKYLKKNERKLVASILDMLGIKSKILIKIVHEFPNVDFLSLISLKSYFGSDFSKYVGNMNSTVFENATRKDSGFPLKNFLLNNHNNQKYYLTQIEKENLFKLINNSDYHRKILSEEKIQLINDHFKMIEKIRDYNPDCYMKAKTYEEFSTEHSELTKIIQAIKKGWVLEYQYDEKTIQNIEEPLDYIINVGTEDSPVFGTDLSMNGKKLYPHILKREEEYIEEGSFMHHCVASYADKDKSMIVSVRSEDESDRVTIEYDIQSGEPIQKRYFCNGIFPEYFKYPMVILDQKIKKQARWGLLNWKEKKKVPVKINGVEIGPENTIKRVTDIFERHTLPF